MTQATITRVIDKPRPWGEKWPGSVSVTVKFADGSIGEVATKEQYAAGHIEALKALLDKPSEFELEARGEYEGIPQFKVKNYPGKPGSDKGGRREYVPRFIDTKEGWRKNDERVDRRKAVELAVAGGWKDVGGLTLIADQLYAWLRKTIDVPEGPPSQVEPHRLTSQKASSSAAGVSPPPMGDTQGPPSGTSSGEGDTPPLTQSSPEMPEGVGHPGSAPSRRDCEHLETETREGPHGKVLTVCKACGLVIAKTEPL